jgi:ASC-1-like (ASCH) protein
MDHIAIMRKDWNLLPKILSGEKRIESRWYMAKYPPWGRIQKGDVVYFKNSGEPVTVKTEVEKVLSFSELTAKKVNEILNKYGKEDGISKEKLPYFAEFFKNKSYCLLIFLKNPQKMTPFEINKNGYGTACAWMCVGDIKKVKI